MPLANYTTFTPIFPPERETGKEKKRAFSSPLHNNTTSVHHPPPPTSTLCINLQNQSFIGLNLSTNPKNVSVSLNLILHLLVMIVLQFLFVC
jgi:hypothetical protein